MSFLGAIEPTRVWMEVTPQQLLAWRDGGGIELPLERTANGQISAARASEVGTALQEWLANKPWLSPLQIQCSIGCRGVILRKITLPSAPESEWNRLLSLQLEAEFPLPPDQLSWGWKLLSISPEGGPTVMLGAVRMEVIREYEAIFQSMNAEVRFSVAALDRLGLVNSSESSVLVLDWGESQSELTVQSPGHLQIRWTPIGSQTWREALQQEHGLSQEEATAILSQTDSTSMDPAIQATLSKRFHTFLTDLSLPIGSKLHLSGSPNSSPLLRHLTGKDDTGGIQFLEWNVGTGRTAANVGSWRLANAKPVSSQLTFQTATPKNKQGVSRGLPIRAIGISLALLAGILLLPYIEAFLRAPRLARQIAGLRADEPHLKEIDRELSFLEHLRDNQGPFFDAVYVIASSAPTGGHIDSIGMNRSGEVALSGFLQNLNLMGDFRLKLIDSGFFSSVVVEDQTPTPDRQRINFRITAQWKSARDREALDLGPKLTNSPPIKLSAPSPSPIRPAP